MFWIYNFTICLQAKQTHDHFSSGNSSATDLFDFIHCDVWDIYHEKASRHSS